MTFPRSPLFVIIAWLCALAPPVRAQITYGHLSVDQLTGGALNPADRSAVVLIHGWTGKSAADAPADMYAVEDWPAVVDSLKARLMGANWKLLLYHWETDASTGPAIDSDPGETGFTHSGEAAGNAFVHGTHLANQLHQGASELRRIIFIAHGAGVWAATQAAGELLKQNPYVVVEVVLLDPFIPGADHTLAPWLNVDAMSQLALLPSADRIYRLENYYAVDQTDFAFDFGGGVGSGATSQSFSWRDRDINHRTDYLKSQLGFPGGSYYGFDPPADPIGHSGPLRFYADGVRAATAGSALPAGLGQAPWNYMDVGFYRSLLYESPLLPAFTEHPQSPSPVSEGATLLLSVSAEQADEIEWFKDGQPLHQIGSTLTFSPIMASDAGSYVARARNSSGMIFSEQARVQISTPPTANITSISPLLFQTKAGGETQLLTIIGNAFTPGSRLTFDDGNGNYFERTPTFVSSTKLSYPFEFASTPASWTVKVVNGNVESPAVTIYAFAPGPQLVGLSIAGPSAISEQGWAEYIATALFSDGTTLSPVAVHWSVVGSAASVSDTGILTTGSVAGDSPVTLTASYRQNGVTKETSAEIKVLEWGAGKTTEALANGSFEGAGAAWSAPVGNSGIVQHASPNSGAWSAYIGGANNATGSFSQLFAVPALVRSATLSFSLNVVSSETTTLDVFDQLKVSLLTEDGESVGLIATLSNLDSGDNVDGVYTLQEFDISALVTPHAGKKLRLVFSGTTNGGAPTIFRVDDVSLRVNTTDLQPFTREAVVNGTFEAGDAPWGTPNGSSDVVATALSHTGAWSAVFGGVNDSSGTVSQLLAIPPFARSATLSFALNVVTAETTTTETFDYLEVRFLTEDNQYIDSVVFYSNLDRGTNTAGVYSLQSFDVSALIGLFEGRKIRLEFLGTTDFGEPTTFRVDDVSLQITAPDPNAFAGLTLDGPTSVLAGNSDQFSLIASFTDGSTQKVRATAWAVDSPAATVDAFGHLTAGDPTTDTTVIVSADYTFNGATRRVSRQVLIAHPNPAAAFLGLVINGPGAIDENSSQQYTATAIFNDGTAQPVTPIWSEYSLLTTVTGAGLFAVGDVSKETLVSLDATYSVAGVTKTTTAGIVIRNGATPPALTALVINGPNYVFEHASAQYQARASFSDGTSMNIAPVWSENGPAAAISSYGQLTAGDVASNTSVTIGASVTLYGTTLSATKTVDIADTPDSFAPGLAITSLADNAVINVSTVTVRGTAGDGGRGNNGISSVTVNGVNATGGTAVGAGVANWSAQLSLTPGSNTISVIARDAFSNPIQRQISVYVILPDLEPPSLAILTPSPASLAATSTIQVTGTAADGNTGVAAVELRINGGDWVPATGTTTWTRSMGVVAGANVIEARCRDNAGNLSSVASVTVNGVLPKGLAFFDDIENGSGAWMPQGTWTPSSESAESPGQAWTDSPNADYANNQNCSLVSPLIDLTHNHTQTTLSFWHRHAFGPGDIGYLWVLPEGGSFATPLHAFSGADDTWHREVFNLSAYAGQRVHLYFQLLSDAGGVAEGWHIDDVTISQPSPQEAYENWAAGAGLTGASAVSQTIPFGDGVQNILKYAFNLNGNGPDLHMLTPNTGTSGLPVLEVDASGPVPSFQLQFVRRRFSALVYTPLESTGFPSGSWVPMSGNVLTSTIDDDWERVTIEQFFDSAHPQRFYTVKVRLP